MLVVIKCSWHDEISQRQDEKYTKYAPEILAVINNRKRNKNLKPLKDQQTIKK